MRTDFEFSLIEAAMLMSCVEILIVWPAFLLGFVMIFTLALRECRTHLTEHSRIESGLLNAVRTLSDSAPALPISLENPCASASPHALQDIPAQNALSGDAYRR